MQRPDEVVSGVTVGLDMTTSNSLRLAVLDPISKILPQTDELCCCRSPRNVLQYWEQRFLPLFGERVVLAINSTRYPDLLVSLQDIGVRVLGVVDHSLRPFLLEAKNYEIPRPFRRAHALANYAQHKVYPHEFVAQAWHTLSEINYYLRDLEAAMHRLSAALGPAVPQAPEAAESSQDADAFDEAELAEF